MSDARNYPTGGPEDFRTDRRHWRRPAPGQKKLFIGVYDENELRRTIERYNAAKRAETARDVARGARASRWIGRAARTASKLHPALRFASYALDAFDALDALSTQESRIPKEYPADDPRGQPGPQGPWELLDGPCPGEVADCGPTGKQINLSSCGQRWNKSPATGDCYTCACVGLGANYCCTEGPNILPSHVYVNWWGKSYQDGGGWWHKNVHSYWRLPRSLWDANPTGPVWVPRSPVPFAARRPDRPEWADPGGTPIGRPGTQPEPRPGWRSDPRPGFSAAPQHQAGNTVPGGEPDPGVRRPPGRVIRVSPDTNPERQGRPAEPHQQRRPGKGEHERKGGARVPPWLQRAVSEALETGDFINALWFALDENLRRRLERRWSTYGGRGPHARKPMPPWKRAEYIFRYWKSIDLKQAVINLATEQIMDTILGRGGRAAGKSTRELTPFGYTRQAGMAWLRRQLQDVVEVVPEPENGYGPLNMPVVYRSGPRSVSQSYVGRTL